MADTKITALTALTAADPANDVIPIVDVNDTIMAGSGTTKKISINNILGASGTATLASATITGDLTVDTSTLKVDSTNNRVGIGTASPLNVLHVLGSTTGNVGRIVGGGSGQPLFLYSDNSGSGVNNGSNGSYGTGLYFSNASNFLAFYTDTGSGGTEKARIDSSGNVGIGVTPSAWQSSIYKVLEFSRGVSLSGQTDAASMELTCNAYIDSAFSWIYKTTAQASHYRQFQGTHQWHTAPSGTAGNAITFTQAMTLDSGGNLLLNATSFSTNNGKLRIQHTGLAGEWAIQTKSNTTDGYAAVFYTTTGQAGFISVSGTSATFSTSSDYRLKEAVQPLVGGLARISALKPSVYKWKADGSNGEGFLAHELAEVVPLAVTGEKDAVNEDGSIKAQGVDLSKVVPVLVAAIQELTARVQTLETR